MTAIADNDISNTELLEAVNNGFTGMQEQMDRMQQQIGDPTLGSPSLQQQLGSLSNNVDQHHQEHQQDHADINDRLDAMERMLKQTIKVTDTHDRQLQRLSA